MQECWTPFFKKIIAFFPGSKLLKGNIELDEFLYILNKDQNLIYLMYLLLSSLWFLEPRSLLSHITPYLLTVRYHEVSYLKDEI